MKTLAHHKFWYVSPSNGHFSNTLAHQMMTVSPSFHDF